MFSKILFFFNKNIFFCLSKNNWNNIIIFIVKSIEKESWNKLKNNFKKRKI